MVTGEKTESGELRILGDEHAVGRLGKGVDAEGRIQPATFDRIANILERYRTTALSLGAQEIAGYGTSALRDAGNRDEFIEEMKRRTGISLRLLPGPDEALWTWRGALFGLPLKNPDVAVLDIGGGSTEVAFGTGGVFSTGTSVNTGAVRVTERFFGHSLPPTSENIEAARIFTRTCFEQSIALPSHCAVVGVAGTVTTLAALAAEVPEFSAERINGRILSRDWIHTITERLLGLSLDEIEKFPQIAKGREDILPGGALVLDEFMQVFDVPEIITSTRGLRYGLLLKEFEEHSGTPT